MIQYIKKKSYAIDSFINRSAQIIGPRKLNFLLMAYTSYKGGFFTPHKFTPAKQVIYETSGENSGWKLITISLINPMLIYKNVITENCKPVYQAIKNI